MRVTGFDHVVLLVADVERSLGWYRDVLGLAGERVEEWKEGRAPFPSVRIDAGTVIDLVQGQSSDRSEGRNVDHICFVIEPIDIDEVVQSGRFDIVEGPGPRWGARGMATSLYVRDPDDNVVELRYY